jgi:hypothetical protein
MKISDGYTRLDVSNRSLLIDPSMRHLHNATTCDNCRRLLPAIRLAIDLDNRIASSPSFAAKLLFMRYLDTTRRVERRNRARSQLSEPAKKNRRSAKKRSQEVINDASRSAPSKHPPPVEEPSTNHYADRNPTLALISSSSPHPHGTFSRRR